MGEFNWAGSQAVSPKGAWNRCVCSAFASKNLIVQARSPRSLRPTLRPPMCSLRAPSYPACPEGLRHRFDTPQHPLPLSLYPLTHRWGARRRRVRVCLAADTSDKRAGASHRIHQASKQKKRMSSLRRYDKACGQGPYPTYVLPSPAFPSR